MNRKIPFHELASLLAGNCNITPAEAEEFIKGFFDLLTQTLSAGETVKIKGVGIFSTTGDASDPVSFTPDAEIAETINAPFAMFEPEEVSDTLSNEAFDALDNQQKPDEEATATAGNDAETADDETVAIEPEPAQTPGTTAGPAAENAPEQEIQPAISPEPQPSPETKIEAEAEPMTETEAEPEISSESETETETETKAETKPEIIPESAAPAPATAPATPPVPPVPAAPAAPKATAAPADIEEEPEEYYQEPQQKSGAGFGWGFVIGLLVGLALGACGVYFAIDYIFPTMPATSYSQVAEDEEEMAALLDSVAAPLAVAADTVAASAPAAASSEPEAEAVPAKTAEETKPAAAAIVKDTVRPGYLLNDMAKKHYGNKCFWVYIYEENKSKIANPNRVGPGLVLVIPPAEKYGINPSSQASIKAANEKAGKILTKYPK